LAVAKQKFTVAAINEQFDKPDENLIAIMVGSGVCSVFELFSKECI
jgi:hypothetical protein